MKILFVVVLCFNIILIESIYLIKKKRWGEFTLTLVLLSIGFTLSFLQVKDVKVPNPNDGIKYLIKMLPSL